METEIRVVPESAFFPLFSQAGAQPLNDAAVTCPNCALLMLESDDLKQIAKEKVAQWEKVWTKYSVHAARLTVKCRECGHETFVTIAFLRFYDNFHPAAKAYVTVFTTEKEQQNFTDALNRILTAEAPN
jgi:hypothetical protein